MPQAKELFHEVVKRATENNMECFGHKTKPQFSFNSDKKEIEFPECCKEFDKRRRDFIESTMNDMGRTAHFQSW